MIFWELDIKDGRIDYDDISHLPVIDIEILDFVDFLKEDMLQISFDNDILLDVGWRPSFDIDGKFYIYLIHDFDWDEPIKQASAQNISELREKLSHLIRDLS